MPPNETRSSRPDANLHGVLIIDKPVGPTSHDVVARMRRTLGTRAIGHAGTLDPAASGVLVIAIGEATKLVPYLTRQTKRYEATVAFGTSTNTLDREGEVTRATAIPVDLVRELARVPETIGPLLGRALANERDRREQVPPERCPFVGCRPSGATALKKGRSSPASTSIHWPKARFRRGSMKPESSSRSGGRTRKVGSSCSAGSVTRRRATRPERRGPRGAWR